MQGSASLELLTCSRCRTAKPATLENFPPHKQTRLRLDSWCRVCRAEYRSKIRRGKFRQFGYNDAFIEALTSLGYCQICNVTGKRLCVDHDHKTGTVRGLLCDDCNFGLGKFRDSPEFLQKARQYLMENPTNTSDNDVPEKGRAK